MELPDAAAEVRAPRPRPAVAATLLAGEAPRRTDSGETSRADARNAAALAKMGETGPPAETPQPSTFQVRSRHPRLNDT